MLPPPGAIPVHVITHRPCLSGVVFSVVVDVDHPNPVAMSTAGELLRLHCEEWEGAQPTLEGHAREHTRLARCFQDSSH